MVDEVEDAELEIELEAARESDPECEVGTLGIKLGVDDLGRIAAQTAKQVIIQKIRDAEREMTFNEFKDRKGELIIELFVGSKRAILSSTSDEPKPSCQSGNRSKPKPIAKAIASKRTYWTSHGLQNHPGGFDSTHPGLHETLRVEAPEIYEGIVRIEAVLVNRVIEQKSLYQVEIVM